MAIVKEAENTCSRGENNTSNGKEDNASREVEVKDDRGQVGRCDSATIVSNSRSVIGCASARQNAHCKSRRYVDL